MNKYVNGILISSIVGGIINSLAPNNKIKKYLNYVVSIVCVLCLLSPILPLISNISNLKSSISNYLDNILVSEKTELSNSLIINTGSEKICSGIKEAIIDKYNFDEKEVKVALVIDKENINAVKIKEIIVTLSGKASWSDAKKIEDYLTNLIGTNINVKRR